MEYQSKMTASNILAGQAQVGAQKASAIESVLDRQQNALAELHRAINSLEDRLRVVSTPPSPPTAKNGEPIAPTQLSHIIEQHNLSIETACKRLHEIMGRLEL